MKILVTGGTGLLGSNVVELLRQNGMESRVLIRKTSNTLGLEGLNPEIYYGDLSNPDSIKKAAEDCQVIVHCAANTKQWKTSWQEHAAVNIKGTQSILSAALANKHRKLILVSTANTFPLINGRALDIDTDYIKSKKAAEDFILEQKDIPATVINPSFMIGARDVKPSSGQSVLHYLNNNPVICPAGGKSFIHVKDVAEAIVKAITSETSGKRFLLANENMSYRRFFKLIRQETGVAKNVFELPAPVSLLAGKAGSLISDTFGLSLKLTSENAALINKNLYYDGSKSYEALGLQKRRIESAIQDAVEWFQKHGYCKIPRLF